MRKAGIIAYSIFFLTLSLGVQLNAHYCGDKLVGVRIALPAPDCCCDGAMDMSNCCSDTSLQIQMDLDQMSVQLPVFSDIQFVGTLIPIIEEDLISFQSDKKSPQLYANPPPPDALSRRILLGSLTFYG